jgi:hypothetical protein
MWLLLPAAVCSSSFAIIAGAVQNGSAAYAALHHDWVRSATDLCDKSTALVRKLEFVVRVATDAKTPLRARAQS